MGADAIPDRYAQVTLSDAVAGTSRRLGDTLRRTGLALTPVDAGKLRRPFAERVFRLEQAWILRDLPVPAGEVFATYRRTWQACGYRVRDGGPEPTWSWSGSAVAATPLVAQDEAGYVLTLRHTNPDELLLTATSPPVGDPDTPRSPGRYAVLWITGGICGAAPQLLLMRLVVTGAGSVPPGPDRQLAALYAVPDLAVLPLTVAIGAALCLWPRGRPFGTGLLTGTAVAALALMGICTSVATAG